jgi:hypothetical protein
MEDIGLNWRKVKWALEKCVKKFSNMIHWLRTKSDIGRSGMGGHSDDPSGSIKAGDVLNSYVKINVWNKPLCHGPLHDIPIWVDRVYNCFLFKIYKFVGIPVEIGLCMFHLSPKYVSMCRFCRDSLGNRVNERSLNLGRDDVLRSIAIRILTLATFFRIIKLPGREADHLCMPCYLYVLSTFCFATRDSDKKA